MMYLNNNDENFLKKRRERQRRRALLLLGTIAASYAIDFLTIALFAWNGTTTINVLLTQGMLALLINSVFYGLFKSGYTLRFADPNLTRTQMSAAVAIQLLCMWLAPNLAFMFLSILFIIFIFGTLRLSVRDALIATGLVIAAVAAILFDIRDRLEIPHATSFEILLVIFSYGTTLTRCMGVGIYGGSMRVQLHRQNKRLHEFSEKIEHLANYDDLTGILNRRSICLLLESEMNRERDSTRDNLFIALLDVDHFKRINDQFGHSTGDEVLKLFTERVQGTLRKNDHIGRYGGEEFLLLFEAESIAQAESIIDRVRATIAEWDWDQVLPGLSITASAGVAAYRAGDSMRQLIGRADIALYQAKHQGRNCVVICESIRA